MAMYELGLEQFDHKNIVLKDVQSVGRRNKESKVVGNAGEEFLQGQIMIYDYFYNTTRSPRWRKVEATDIPAVDSLSVNSPLLAVVKETFKLPEGVTEEWAQKILLQGELSGDLVIFDGLNMDDTIYHLIKNGIYLV